MRACAPLLTLFLTLAPGVTGAQMHDGLSVCRPMPPGQSSLQPTAHVRRILHDRYKETEQLYVSVIRQDQIAAHFPYYAELARQARSSPAQGNIIAVVYRNPETGTFTGIVSFDTGVSCAAINDNATRRRLPKEKPEGPIDPEDERPKLRRKFYDASY